MLQALDVRDAVDSDRFVQVHFDPVCEQKFALGPAAAAGGANAIVAADAAALAHGTTSDMPFILVC